jgi:hypothetical protein
MSGRGRTGSTQRFWDEPSQGRTRDRRKPSLICAAARMPHGELATNKTFVDGNDFPELPIGQ